MQMFDKRGKKDLSYKYNFHVLSQILLKPTEKINSMPLNFPSILLHTF